MRTAILAVLAVLLVLSGAGVGCGYGFGSGPVVLGSGKLETREMDFSDFTRVEVGNAFHIEVVHSDSYAVSITADDNLFEQYIRVSRRGDALKVRLALGHTYRSTTLRARVSMPDIRTMELSGASQGSLRGFSSTQDRTFGLSGASALDVGDLAAGSVSLGLSGASAVTGEMAAAGDLELELSGASRAKLEGSAGDLFLHASGASGADLSGLAVENADVRMSGASHATVNPGGTLDANLSGASGLRYVGEPGMGRINTSGGSTLKKED